MFPARCIQPACRNMDVRMPDQSCPMATRSGTMPQVSNRAKASRSSPCMGRVSRKMPILATSSAQVTQGVRPDGL